jgi:hypothetical protein
MGKLAAVKKGRSSGGSNICNWPLSNLDDYRVLNCGLLSPFWAHSGSRNIHSMMGLSCTIGEPTWKILGIVNKKDLSI